MSVRLSEYAEITSDGAILLGKHTVVDGHHYDREIGIVTHVHMDHIQNLTQTLHECSRVYMSPPTFDLLAARHSNEFNVSGETYFRGRHIYRMDFGEPLRPPLRTREPGSPNLYADKITLFRAQHILGSAQVLIETGDGKRIAYSSDFTQPGTKPIECDVLVLDATHGSPAFDAPVHSPSLKNRLLEYIDREIQNGNSICIRAHAGRLQYIMHVLSSRFPNIPFITSGENARMARVYDKYGFGIKELMLDDTLKSRELLMAESALFIEFKGASSSQSDAEIANRAAVFNLGGIPGSKTAIRIPDTNNKHYRLELADHANYSQILQYVKDCNPKLVITDSYRSKSHCVKLAKSIREKLKIDAIAQPV